MATWPNVNNTNISTQDDEIIVYQNGINYVQNLGTFSAAVDQGQWVPTFDYEVNTVVRGSDGKRYISIQESGPNKGGAQDPTSTPLYWFDCTGIFKSRQATAQEALNGADVDAYVPPDLVHAAFNQYGLGGQPLDFVDDLDNIDIANKSFAFTTSSSSLGLAGFGELMYYGSGQTLRVLMRVFTIEPLKGQTLDSFERMSSDGGVTWSDWIQTLSSRDKADASTAEDGVDDGKYMTPLKTKQQFLANEEQIGVNQSWTNVTSSRDVAITYTNNTGKPIMIAYSGNPSTGSSLTFFVNGSKILELDDIDTGFALQGFTAIVPESHTYRVEYTNNGSTNLWAELR